ncbi:MAG: NFACT RNA binding domain-containing protein [Lachnospiraceae bacterium]|nr:NFACT RNA binding domain-containing protein [Lachnospiraceae bacterium]MDD3615094.1 NFACT RNA binding domain-containing protein [Lachnospiraceae bacterium]
MAFDGITIANIVYELKQTILGGRISKIAQPETDELLIAIKNNRTQYRLLLSASASLPLIYLTSTNKQSPMTAPNFCMLLRKHIGSGKIIDITQPDFERVVQIQLEHLNELGDICTKYLIIEIMGKHSNIIFCDDNMRIIDSIKHISANMSSVREVLPGRDYFIPSTQDKISPYMIHTQEDFWAHLDAKPCALAKALYTSFNGISPIAAEEILYRAGIDSALPSDAFKDLERTHIFHTFERFFQDIDQNQFAPSIYYNNDEPVEFSSFTMQQYSDYTSTSYESISQVLEEYYAAKDAFTRIHQKSSDLRRVVGTALERSRKKLDLQTKQMKDTEKMEKYRIYGELIHTYGYSVPEGAKSFQAVNYYNNEEITIPLDETKSPAQNAKKYFDRYNKLKRTQEALSIQLKDTREEIEHLESISNSLEIARGENDLVQLKEELMDSGYIKRKYHTGKKVKILSKPLHYISSDGYHMYVGKNNYQNEELTFQFATGNDWWFHAKGQPGSHVIVKSNNEELPDRTFEEAGRLAAHYSKGKLAPKVEIDYTQKKNIKKPSGSKPGFVIYYTNYSLMIEPDISMLKEITE